MLFEFYHFKFINQIIKSYILWVIFIILTFVKDEKLIYYIGRFIVSNNMLYIGEIMIFFHGTMAENIKNIKKKGEAIYYGE